MSSPSLSLVPMSLPVLSSRYLSSEEVFSLVFDQRSLAKGVSSCVSVVFVGGFSEGSSRGVSAAPVSALATPGMRRRTRRRAVRSCLCMLFTLLGFGFVLFEDAVDGVVCEDHECC